MSFKGFPRMGSSERPVTESKVEGAKKLSKMSGVFAPKSSSPVWRVSWRILPKKLSRSDIV